MPRKAPKQVSSAHLQAEVFLRSINLPFDIEFPERIEHFQPTTKTLSLVRALLRPEGRTAFFVVAPYGSGKSITASYIVQLVENRPDAEELLLKVETRLQAIDPELAEAAGRRREHESHGLALALHGYCPSLPEALKEAALATMERHKLGRQARSIRSQEVQSIEDALELLDILQDKAEAVGHDRIVILWDEFGRHVESLIAAGRAAELDELQLLAEYVSRSATVPMTLGLLLHQTLLRYAGNLPQSLRAEWKKIEGRFETLQFIDDSHEIYRLIGEIVSSRRNGSRPPTQKVARAARRAQEVGLFSEMGRKELAGLLGKAYPLEPATLYLLPRLSARVAQNERTLFSFLFATNLEETVGPEKLYDYFSGEMRSDIAAGGTYRQHLETESALSKLDGDELAARTLKAACLLSLGLGGERSRASREALSFASQGYSSETARDPVGSLIEKKLLLYRKHADQVAVWHGTDVDLRGRLEEEMRRRVDTFDFLSFLSRHVPPPYWRPLRYNDDYQLRRFFSSEYRQSGNLEEYLGEELSSEALPLGCDGKVVYVIPSDDQELESLRAEVEKNLHHPQILIVLPGAGLDLQQAALEVWCLLQLKKEGDLTGADPLLDEELDQMTDDARAHLQRLVDRLVTPTPDGAQWFHQGEDQEFRDVRHLRSHLSDLMEEVFPETPLLNNELIVKNSPSSVIVNARKRLVLGILERTDKEDFGLVGNGPDKSMYYTLLMNTGLFREENDGRWARPSELEDKGLQAVWAKLQGFLTEPSPKPKEVSALLEEFQAPPFGVRKGVFPILIAAGLKAFPSIRALVRNGEYVKDILASDIEALCDQPEDHQLLVHELDGEREQYLGGILELFEGEKVAASSPDLIRRCYDALIAWREELPPGALATRKLTPAGLELQRLLQEPGNPLELFFARLPRVLGFKVEEVQESLDALQKARNELLQVETRYQEEAGRVLGETLHLGSRQTNGTLRSAASQWAECFSSEFFQNLRSTEIRGFLTRLKMPYSDDAALLGSVASLLLGKAFHRWEDSTIALFEDKLRTVVEQIESKALSEAMSSETSVEASSQAMEGLTTLVTARLEEQIDQLVGLIGVDETRQRIDKILREDQEERL